MSLETNRSYFEGINPMLAHCCYVSRRLHAEGTFGFKTVWLLGKLCLPPCFHLHLANVMEGKAVQEGTYQKPHHYSPTKHGGDPFGCSPRE